jgi:hypothetical protein
VSQQNYAYLSDGQGFELLEASETVRDPQPPVGRAFALSSELANRPAHSKLREALQKTARPEKRAYFTEESQAQKGLQFERLLKRSQMLESKLFQKKGERKS